MDYKEWILNIRDYKRNVSGASPQDVIEYAYYHLEDSPGEVSPLSFDEVQTVINHAASAMIHCEDEAQEAYASALSMSQNFMSTSYESNKNMAETTTALLYDTIDYLKSNIVALAHVETLRLKDELDDLVGGKGDTIFHRKEMQDDSEYYAALREMAELYNERVIVLSQRIRTAISTNEYNLMESMSESITIYSKVIGHCVVIAKELSDNAIGNDIRGGDNNGNNNESAV